MPATRNESNEQGIALTSEEKSEMGLNLLVENQGFEEKEADEDEEEKHLNDTNDVTISLVSNGSSDDDKKRINFGEYEITLPQEKVPLLGVLACAMLLHVTIFIDEDIYSSNYRYGIILSNVAFFAGVVSIAIPTKKAIGLNYIIYLLTYTSACLSTMESGPFSKTGNGYFASWGLAICSGIAADPPGSLKRALFNSTLNLGVAALVVMISLLPSLIEGVPEYQTEVYIATACASLTMIVVGLFLTLKLCTWNTSKNACGESLVLSCIACAWVVIACLVTFRGPFLETGNGYFASWFAVAMSVKAAGLEWRNRVQQDGANKDS